MILGAVWIALWFAERLGAAGLADWPRRRTRWARATSTCACRSRSGDDEIALLGRAFNDMTRQVKGQRDALIEANSETERPPAPVQSRC